ncbi:O-acyltransferase [Forsythia ovata]|uniref:O-acyltransferase n=1 Tax=Forsythia ovata TaxID=205694 RepID=A0ABD1UX81_9LAMI
MTTSNTHHRRATSTVRQRSSVVAVLESDFNSLDAVNDSDGDVNNNNGMKNLYRRVVELVWEKSSESGTKGWSNGKDEENKMVRTGWNNQGMAEAAVEKFSSQPLAPAHHRRSYGVGDPKSDLTLKNLEVNEIFGDDRRIGKLESLHKLGEKMRDEDAMSSTLKRRMYRKMRKVKLGATSENRVAEFFEDLAFVANDYAWGIFRENP